LQPGNRAAVAEVTRNGLDFKKYALPAVTLVAFVLLILHIYVAFLQANYSFVDDVTYVGAALLPLAYAARVGRTKGYAASGAFLGLSLLSKESGFSSFSPSSAICCLWRTAVGGRGCGAHS